MAQAHTSGGRADTSREGPIVALGLLGRFRVAVNDHTVEVHAAGQRVIAALALDGGAGHRAHTAEQLWPGSAPGRALANLRGAIWRLPDSVRAAVTRRGAIISLTSGWSIDVDEVSAHASDLAALDRAQGRDARLRFDHDILPAWGDDWLTIRRERYRQLRLHALEDLAVIQLEAGRARDAVDTIMMAIEAQPLRESSQAVLLRAHLRAGNHAAAHEQYGRYRAALSSEYGVEPGPTIRHLLDGPTDTGTTPTESSGSTDGATPPRRERDAATSSSTTSP